MINNTIRNLTSFKRQIEILTLFYPELRIQNCKIEDLAYKFNVSVPTINRDLQDLRKMGISINSEYGKGLALFNNVQKETVADLFGKYIVMYYSDIYINKILFNGVTDSKMNYLYIFTSLNDSILNQQKVFISYEWSKSKIINEKVLPRQIIRLQDELAFIGVYGNSAEIFKFSRIKDIRITNEKDAKRYDDIIIKVLDEIAAENKSKLTIQLVLKSRYNIGECEISLIKVITEDNGIVKAEAEFQDLELLALWAIENRGLFLVLEPKELRDRILEIAKKTQEEYEKLSKEKADGPMFIRRAVTEDADKGEKDKTTALYSPTVNWKPEPGARYFIPYRYNYLVVDIPINYSVSYSIKNPSIFEKIYNKLKRRQNLFK